MSTDRVPALARLLALMEDPEAGPEDLQAAGRAVLALPAGAAALREALRQASLFAGFPRVVRTLGLLAPLLPPAPPPPLDPPPPPGTGHRLFQRLYGPDAGRVLARLRALDPVLASWILEHAYGTVLARPGLTLEERERLAVLLLAAAGCWDQWTSHVRNALRLGVSEDRLDADLDLVSGWPPAARRREARARLHTRQAPGDRS